MVDETKTENTQETSAEAPSVDPIAEKIKALDEATNRANEATATLKAEKALQQIGGQSDLGTSTEKKAETDQEYVDRMRKQGWKADA